jgi:hypothetical protein
MSSSDVLSTTLGVFYLSFKPSKPREHLSYRQWTFSSTKPRCSTTQQWALSWKPFFLDGLG